MSRFFIASSIGLALLTTAPGCSGEQGSVRRSLGHVGRAGATIPRRN